MSLPRQSFNVYRVSCQHCHEPINAKEHRVVSGGGVYHSYCFREKLASQEKPKYCQRCKIPFGEQELVFFYKEQPLHDYCLIIMIRDSKIEEYRISHLVAKPST